MTATPPARTPTFKASSPSTTATLGVADGLDELVELEVVVAAVAVPLVLVGDELEPVLVTVLSVELLAAATPGRRLSRHSVGRRPAKISCSLVGHCLIQLNSVVAPT